MVTKIPRNKVRVQKSAGEVLASISWDHDGILLIDYLPKGHTINVEHYSCVLVQLKDILKEKHRGKVTKVVLFLHDKYPDSPGTCNPKETGIPGLPMSWSPILFSWILSRRTTTCSLDWKNNWKVAIFLPTLRSLMPRRPGWTGNIQNFFEWLADIRARG